MYVRNLDGDHRHFNMTRRVEGDEIIRLQRPEIFTFGLMPPMQPQPESGGLVSGCKGDKCH
jgi:hypothetical protein